MRSWFSHLWSPSARQKSPRPRRIFLSLEPLEDRRTPAVLTVTTAADDLTPNDGSVSLREAIAAINAGNNLGDPDVILQNPGTFGVNDTINFNIAGSGVRTINVGASGNGALPALTKPVTINGYSENNGTTQATANTLANGDNARILIELNGANAGANANGIEISGGGSTIEGLAINRFSVNGIQIDTSGGNIISGNFVGTNPQGNAAEPNQNDGIRISNASNNTIGGITPDARNVVSGNQIGGIHVVGALAAPATGNVIEGNFVGVNAAGTGSVGVKAVGGAAGTPAGNDFFGIEISGGNSNTVGGVTAGARNVVGFNADGIEIDNGGQNNVIQGNFSGVGADGVTPVGNNLHGIALRSDSGFNPPLGPAQPNEPGVQNNTVGGAAAGAGNLVEFNGTGGVAVFSNPVSLSGQANIGNAILGNSIFENSRSNPTFLLGIDLTNGFAFPKDDGSTPNDSKGHGAANDPNNFQNFPVLTAVSPVTGGGTTITGSLMQNISPNTMFRIEFFANNADPAGGIAEGQTFLGFTTVTTNASGNASFSVTVTGSAASGQVVTATATEPGNNTSEFSAGLAVPPPPTVQFSTTSQSVNETDGTFTATVTLSAASGSDTTIPFTLGGTAAAGVDYSNVTASPLVIKAGQISGVITGTLINDGAPDAVKTLTLTLGTPTNATLGATTTETLTIADSPPMPPPPLQQMPPPFVSVAFGPAGEVLEVVSSAGVLTQFDAAGAHQLGNGGVRAASVAFGPFGEVLEVVGTNGVLTQFDAFGVHQLGNGGVLSASVAFGPFGEVLEVVDTTGVLRQFDAGGVHQLGNGGVQSASVAFTASGEVLQILLADGTLRQFDSLGVHPVLGGVESAGVAFGPAGEVLDVIFMDGTLDQFDATGVRTLGKLF